MKSVAITSWLVVLTACAVSTPLPVEPDLGDHVVTPEQWSAVSLGAADASSDAVTSHWWNTFGDPLIGALVAEALAHNNDLDAAAARVEAAAAQAVIAGAPAYPTLDLEGNGQRRGQTFVGLPIPSAGGGVARRTYNSFGVSLVTSWELDLWGRIRAGRNAAQADFEATAVQLWAARESIAAQTTRAYLAAVEAELQLQLARDTVVLFSRTEQLVENRFAQGIRPALDLRLARNNRASSEAFEQNQRARLDRAKRQLELLLGRYPQAAVAAALELPDVPATVPAGLPAELLRRRPDVMVAERRLAATVLRVDEARAALFPRIGLTASGGYNSDEFDDLLDSDLFVWDVIGNLLQPVFDGGRLASQVDFAEARAREATADYAGTALRAYTEVEIALAEERILRQQADHLAVAAEEASAAGELAAERYRDGLEDILAVIESQRRAVTAASDLIGVQRLILDVRVDLHLALGGAFGQTWSENPDGGDS